VALWLVRGGAHGEYERRFLEDGQLYLTWTDGLQLHDLSQARTHDSIRTIVDDCYPGEPAKRIINWTGQIWAFVVPMKPGDWIAMPRKGTALIAIGEITGPYQYDPKADEPYRHRRSVKWLNKEVPRSAFGQDLLYSLGAFLTVCAITRNDAEQRVRAMPARGWKSEPGLTPSAQGVVADGEETPVDLELLARDQIAKLVMARFQGHGLALLVEAVLKAQGYTTYRSPEGADKGVDILAATGPLGFGEPRICVQVKSGDTPVDRPTLDQLIGVMANFKADRGLLVSWGGFKGSVSREVANQFFSVRLWDRETLLGEILEHYNSLPDELRAELPLKRFWALAAEDQEA
jgi:restriction system protein